MVPEIWIVTNIIFCHYGPFFALLGGYGPRKSKFWKKKKKALEDIIILQMFTINNSHMTYGFSDMESNRQNFLSFWTVFCHFTPTTQKNQILKKWKKIPQDIIILHKWKCTKKKIFFNSIFLSFYKKPTIKTYN